MKIYEIIWFGHYGKPNFGTGNIYSTLELAKVELERVRLIDMYNLCYDKVVTDKALADGLEIYERYVIYEREVI